MKTKKNILTLDKLPLNVTGYICNINCNEIIRRRLLDLGLVKDSAITPVLVNPFGDPRAFEVRGFLLAIRDEDTKLIDIYL